MTTADARINLALQSTSAASAVPAPLLNAAAFDPTVGLGMLDGETLLLATNPARILGAPCLLR